MTLLEWAAYLAYRVRLRLRERHDYDAYWKAVDPVGYEFDHVFNAGLMHPYPQACKPVVYRQSTTGV